MRYISLWICGIATHIPIREVMRVDTPSEGAPHVAYGERRDHVHCLLHILQ
jgi:hypothetical protein